jgi:hypothetical protein
VTAITQPSAPALGYLHGRPQNALPLSPRVSLCGIESGGFHSISPSRRELLALPPCVNELDTAKLKRMGSNRQDTAP